MILSSSSGPQYTPARWMQFVDGENLTIRAQELVKANGKQLVNKVFSHWRDCFFWPGMNATALGFPLRCEPSAIRSSYYTSCVGAENVLEDLRQRIRNVGFEPHVFKRDPQTKRSKGVDIALTKDLLSHAFRDNFDVVRLVSGDGDYVPVIEEVKRLGKRVEVVCIQKHSSPALYLAADTLRDISYEVENWACLDGRSVAYPATSRDTDRATR